MEQHMNQLSLQLPLSSASFRERRKNDRYNELDLFIITSRGTGKIIDISRDGLSFGCLYHHAFPATWSLEIIDAKGVHLKQLSVIKIWEKRNRFEERYGNFELEIGVEFTRLSERQEEQLDLLFRNLIFPEIEYRSVF
jgi:hypothetical protein